MNTWKIDQAGGFYEDILYMDEWDLHHLSSFDQKTEKLSSYENEIVSIWNIQSNLYDVSIVWTINETQMWSNFFFALEILVSEAVQHQSSV